MNRQARALSLVCVSVLAACGDDDDGGGGTTVDTGLPASAELSSLDEGDTEQLCTSLADSFNGLLSDDDFERISCTVLAIPLSLQVADDGRPEGDVPKCKMLVDECMNGETISDEEPIFEVQREFIDDTACEDLQPSSLDTCEASVADFEKCASAQLKTLSSRFDLINCDSLRDPDALMGMLSEDLNADSVCGSFEAKCPDVSIGGDEEEDSDSD